MKVRVRPSAGPLGLRCPERRDYTRFRVSPVGVSVGGLIEGVDLRQPCDDGLQEALAEALRDWKVIFFRDQDLTLEQHAAFAARWGVLTDDTLVPTTAARPEDNVVVFVRDAATPGLENEWHTDGTFRPVPTMGTILRAIEVPEVGGDTLFADMGAAFDILPRDVRKRIVSLTAVHDWSIGAYAGKYADRLDDLRAAHPPVVHPVVIRHPETGRPTLFVNRLFTREIVGLTRDDSTELLDGLCSMVDVPEIQARWKWEPGSVAMWDNLACNHYGANDYYPARRVMARATFFSLTHARLEPAGPLAPVRPASRRRSAVH